MNSENLRRIVDSIYKIPSFQKLPSALKETVEIELKKIREIVLDNRAPRIMIIGRRGAGKSSLINAIFKAKVAAIGSVVSETGKAQWHIFQNAKGAIRILDTRGIGDRTKPAASAFGESIDEIKCEIEKQCPDVMLFLCKAKEVDARILEDIQSVITIKDFVIEKHGYNVPLAAVITQIDELDPKRIEPPYENIQKQNNIELAVQTLEKAFKEANVELISTIPVSAYAEYDNDTIIYNNSFNIDLLVFNLIEVIPNSAQLQLARISAIKKVQKRLSYVLIGAVSTICGTIAITPIPIADIIPITAAQIAMIMSISYISGREFSKQNAREFLAAIGVNVGLGFTLREGARAIIKLVAPIYGSMVSAVVASTGTLSIGEAAISYFIDQQSIEEVRSGFSLKLLNK